MTSPDQYHLKGLMAALDEAHAAVRTYDTKAQVVGIGYIFSLGVIFNILKAFDAGQELGALQLLAAFVLSIGPVILFGAILYPSRKVLSNTPGARGVVKGTFYCLPGSHEDLDAYVEAIKSTDWLREIAFEIVKVSALRDVKRQRFIRALVASGISFSLLMGAGLVNLLRAAG